MIDAAIRFEEVDVLYPRTSDGSMRRRSRSLRPGTQRTRVHAAIAACDAGDARDEIARQHHVTVAVRGASLTIGRGEFVVVMGLSGSGKSTLLRTANRLTPVTRGHVWVPHEGAPVDVATCDPGTLRRLRLTRIAMVFQQFALIPTRTVRQNVGLGLEFRGESLSARTRIADEKLALVGLADWADRPIGELSGGMQQRVGLARALATDADILLMDEPFSALDAVIRRRLQDELRALQAQVHKTVLFVTHDIDEAFRLGDRIAVMQEGRIVQVGTPDAIRNAPASAYVADFLKHER
jgi:glycine betaine/proline transport system ATP-binding protein